MGVIFFIGNWSLVIGHFRPSLFGSGSAGLCSLFDQAEVVAPLCAAFEAAHGCESEGSPLGVTFIEVGKKAKGLAVRVVNMCSVVPMDRAAVVAAAKTGVVVTAEDHNVNTGLGTLVGSVLAEEGARCAFRKCGVRYYGASGEPGALVGADGLDAAG